MYKEQEYSPKYWVVHDKRSDDIFISTAHKSKFMSERLFVQNTLMTMFDGLDEQDAFDLYCNEEDYECILIEIKSVDIHT